MYREENDEYFSCIKIKIYHFAQGESDENQDCGPQRAGKDYQCVDPCAISCGQGADCTVQNHVAICRCPRGTTGDPFRNCRRFTREEICAPCGANTDCEVSIMITSVHFIIFFQMMNFSWIRWDPMTGQSAVARTPTLGTRCRVVDTNATRTMSAASRRSVTGSPIGVRLHVVYDDILISEQLSF